MTALANVFKEGGLMHLGGWIQTMVLIIRIEINHFWEIQTNVLVKKSVQIRDPPLKVFLWCEETNNACKLIQSRRTICLSWDQDQDVVKNRNLDQTLTRMTIDQIRAPPLRENFVSDESITLPANT